MFCCFHSKDMQELFWQSFPFIICQRIIWLLVGVTLWALCWMHLMVTLRELSISVSRNYSFLPPLPRFIYIFLIIATIQPIYWLHEKYKSILYCWMLFFVFVLNERTDNRFITACHHVIFKIFIDCFMAYFCKIT
jgi:hypothetical protein